MRTFVCGLLTMLALESSAFGGTFKTVQVDYLGTSVIHFEGKITKGDLERLKAAISLHRGPRGSRHTFFSLNSSGGVVEEAISIALYLREHGIGTIVLPKAI